MLLTLKDILNAKQKGFNGKKEAFKASKPEREKMAFRFNNTKECGHKYWDWDAKDFSWDGKFFYVRSGRGVPGQIVERDGKTYWQNHSDKQGVLISSEDDIKMMLRTAAAGRIGGAAKTEAKKAASRENGKKGGRPPIDEFNAEFPVIQDFQSGLWGWRRENGCIDLKKCTFKSRAAAFLDREKGQEEARWESTRMRVY
jgi:hypothetical protein